MLVHVAAEHALRSSGRRTPRRWGSVISISSRSGNAQTRFLGLSSGAGWFDRTTLERDHRERDAVDIDVLGRQQSLPSSSGSGVVVHPPQPAAHDLLAEQLAAERPDAQDVRDVVGVPALGEHGDGHDAADVLARLARLAHGGDDPPQFLGGGLLVLGRVFALGLREQLGVDADRDLRGRACWRTPGGWHSAVDDLLLRLVLLRLGGASPRRSSSALTRPRRPRA